MSHSQVNLASAPNAPARPVRRRRFKLGIVPLAFLAIIYTGFDLPGPRLSQLRSFDPNEVARLDTVVWRSY